MRDSLVDALRALLAERLGSDAELRKAYADLRETCAYAIDPRHADGDLVRLLARYPGGKLPISDRFEAVLSRLPPSFAMHRAREEGVGGGEPSILPIAAQPLRESLKQLLRDHFSLAVEQARVLDPWAGDGSLLAAFEAAQCHGNEADIVGYAEALCKGQVCLADSFRLPDRSPTLGFSFSEDENAERIAEQQTLEFEVILSDLRNATRPDARAQRRVRETYGTGLAVVRWMSDRLGPKGIVAFVSDGQFIDEPSLAGMRASLEKEFGHIAHLALGESLGLTFFVRGGRRKGIFYGNSPRPSGGEGLGVRGHEPIEWRELEPTPAHVWRTEILAPEWATFLPLVGERGAIFTEGGTGAPDGQDTAEPKAKGARKVLRRPFAPAWRTLDRKARREPWPAETSTIVVLREPFGVVATNGPVDRRFGGARVPIQTAGGPVSPSALRRFRSEYGAGIVERDVFDYALALLHHPEYRERYREDLRRGVPRLPILDPDRLEALSEIEGAPTVGPGSAFGTGWLDQEDFEPGTVPDYDDPFASPYARADVEPGFLLFAGLGAALYRVEVDFERLVPYPLEGIESGSFHGRIERLRLSRDRTTIVVGPTLTLSGIPPEAFEAGIGARSPLEWVVATHRVRPDFDPNRADDPERVVRLVGQAITAGLEIDRLSKLVCTIEL